MNIFFFSPYGFWIFWDSLSVTQQQQRSNSSKTTLCVSNKGYFVVLEWEGEGHGTDRHTDKKTLKGVDKIGYEAGQVKTNKVYLKLPTTTACLHFLSKERPILGFIIQYPNCLIGPLNGLNKMLLYFGHIQWKPHTLHWLMAAWRYMVECLYWYAFFFIFRSQGSIAWS